MRPCMLLRAGVLAAAALALTFALPLNEPSKVLSTVDDLETQALIVLGKNGSPGVFKNFLPLVNHAVVFAGAVLPSVKAHKENKHTREFTESMLVQTVASGAGKEESSDVEKFIPTGESMLEAMIAIGNVVGGSSGFNPIQMMSNLVGKKEMEASIDEILHFPLRFPDPTNEEIALAEQVVLSVGLGFGDQEDAIQHFINGISKDKREMIEHLEKNVIERVVNAMMLPNGDPTPALIEEIKSQMREMEKRKGNSDMMPEELKEMVARGSQGNSNRTAVAAVGMAGEERSEIQTLIATSQEAVTGKFKNLFPLLNQALVYSGAVLPSLRANKEHKHNSELSASLLVQTLQNAANSTATVDDGNGKAKNATVRDSEEVVSEAPPAEALLEAMIGVGNLIGGVSGFNPVALMTNVVGKADMTSVIDELIQFTLEFPDPTPAELAAAEEVALSIGLGYGNQEEAVQHFVSTLTDQQKQMLERLQKNALEKLLKAMTMPDGSPSPKLVEELKRQMSEMEKRGMEDFVPVQFKDILREVTQQHAPQRRKVSLEEEALAQAFLAVHADKNGFVFRNFLPMVNQAVLYTGVVLPTAKAGKALNKKRAATSAADKLAGNLLVQTIAAAGERRLPEQPQESSDLEKALPTADDLLGAMVAIGNVMGGSSGFNAVELLEEVVGKENMTKVIDEVIKFPLRFPDPTESDVEAAEEVVLALGLGFGDQETALQTFIKKLDPVKTQMIESLEKTVMEKVVGALMLPNGDPTPTLVAAIRKQMREMEKRKGNTDMMPQELKDLATATSDERLAEVQALVALQDSTTTKEPRFKDLLPMVGHVITYTGAVLPGVVAARKHKHNADLGGVMLVETVAQAAGTHQEADWERMLPTSEDMLTAMVAIGNVMGSGSGFNPMKMAVTLIGHDDMIQLIDTIMKFPFRFPDLDDKQLAAAEQCLLSMALGFGDQKQSIGRFIETLNSEQQHLLTDLQKNVFEKLMSVMSTANGEPSKELVEEIKHQMQAMQERTGNTDMMPEELKQLVAESEAAKKN